MVEMHGKSRMGRAQPNRNRQSTKEKQHIKKYDVRCNVRYIFLTLHWSRESTHRRPHQRFCFLSVRTRRKYPKWNPFSAQNVRIHCVTKCQIKFGRCVWSGWSPFAKLWLACNASRLFDTSQAVAGQTNEVCFYLLSKHGISAISSISNYLIGDFSSSHSIHWAIIPIFMFHQKKKKTTAISTCENK